ncbi:DUF2314 domain-containing protein [Persicirhabdus sediminis]|uniref:DUF2314 domain-containing protein n=1 Tax=Persicirhabdus sediminis TaxID=454144 RepID=A0A8J7MFS9_9BACT|nr:DUF2314 domain-containing protein [Persicirhabdus sediminis]MBK1791933.1 DUF2314 domain-containing protein [Persicirhabdus sediminis]
MNIKNYLIALALTSPFFTHSLSLAEESDPADTLFDGEYNDAKMDQAMKEARKNLAKFKASLSRKSATNHAIKVAIRDGETVEHFWLIDLRPIEGGFIGTLNNDPGLVSNVENWR